MILFFSGKLAFIPAVKRIAAGGSFNQRVLRGIIVYQEIPPFYQFFGVGLNNLEPYMNENNISTYYDEWNLNYCASFIQTLNYSGIIGLLSITFLMINYLFKAINLRDYKNNLVFVFLLSLLFIFAYESILFTYRFAFLIVIFESVVSSGEKYRQKKSGCENYLMVSC